MTHTRTQTAIYRHPAQNSNPTGLLLAQGGDGALQVLVDAVEAADDARREAQRDDLVLLRQRPLVGERAADGPQEFVVVDGLGQVRLDAEALALPARLLARLARGDDDGDVRVEGAYLPE